MDSSEAIGRCAREVDALGSVTRERDLPDALADAVQRATGASVIAIFLARRDEDGPVLMASRGITLARRWQPVPERGLVARCAASGRSVVRALETDLVAPMPLSLEALLEVAVPIRSAGAVQGVIACSDAEHWPALKLLGVAGGLALLHARSASARLEARRVAELDPLTGLANKAVFRDALETAVASGERAGEPVSLLIFDIDHFKQYNDHHGHPAGDRVLEEMAELVRRSFRLGHDLAARFGGEEFVVLFPGTPKARAHDLAERFRRAVEAHPFPYGGTQPLGRLTVSGGVAAHPDDAGSAAELIEVADRWLYEAKRLSRNRISIAEGDAGPRVLEITERR